MTAFLNHFSFEFRTGIRNRQLLFLNYMFPIIFYLMMGFIMLGINPMFSNTMVPAMVVFAVLAACLMGIPEFIVRGREAGIFRSYKINGIPASSILIVPSLTTGLHMLIVTILITASAKPLFDVPLPINWLNFALVFLALTISIVGISMLIGVISPSTNFQVILSQLIFIPSVLLGGMMIPFSMLPDAAGMIARLMPATQAMNAFNGLAMGYPADFNPWFSVIALLVSGLIGFGLAIYMFNWDSKNTEPRGHILLGLLVLVPFVVGFLFH
ncbi:MAG: ABC transporter permease [Anaerolineales bacterium]|jgi:ABC-2 type transport system permease protein